MAKRNAKKVEVINEETSNTNSVDQTQENEVKEVDTPTLPVESVISDEANPSNTMPTNTGTNESDSDDSEENDSELEEGGEEKKTRKNYLRDVNLLFNADQIDEARMKRDSINAEMVNDGAKGFVRLYKMKNPNGDISYAIGRHSGDCADAIITAMGWTSELQDGKSRGRVADPNTVLKNTEKMLDKLTPEQIQDLLRKHLGTV